MKTILLATLTLLSFNAFADADRVAAMRKRVPAIVEMKEKGLIGEQPDGLLGYARRSASEEESKIVDAENKDREAEYQERATVQNIPVATLKHVLGTKRVEQEPKGRMIPDAKGHWIKK
jgi:uncharacterized protein YdbL (DUF1318 family)